MHRTSGKKWLRWLGVLAAVVTAVVSSSASPAAAIKETMDPFEVQVVEHATPTDKFVEPEDGRLRGYGFAADVQWITEAAWVDELFTEWLPPEGFKILAFGVKLDIVQDRDDEHPIRATVIVDGKRIAVDHPFAVSGGPIIAASVPVDAKAVEFEMESAGTAQRFSLTEARRVGMQPLVLYRDPAWPDVTTDVNADRIVKISDDEAEAQAALLVNSVRLSWFSPRNPVDVGMAERNPGGRSTPVDPVTSPTSSRKAFLIVQGVGTGITPNEGPWFDDLAELPEADVKVKLPDGAVIESKLPNPKDGGPLLGRHYFEVPADITNFTLMVGPSSVAALRVTDDLSVPTTARLEGGSWDVTLPPGNPPVQSEEPAAPATTNAAAPRNERDRESDESASGALAALVAVIAAGALATLVLLVRRRRRGRPGQEPVPTDASFVADVVDEDVPAVELLQLADGPSVRVAGPGAADAVRASIVERRAHTDVVLLARDETAALLSLSESAGASFAADEEELLASVEVAHLHHVRERTESNGSSRDQAHHGRALLVVAPASIREDAQRQLDAAIGRASAEDALADYEATVVYVAGASDDADIRVDSGIAYIEGSPAHRPVATMTATEAADALTESVAARPAPEASSPTAPQRVSIRVLGTFRIHVGDRELASGLRTKARELLAYLAVNREGATADAAVEALWPGTEPEKGQAYFRTIVANIRNVLRVESGAAEDAAFINRVGQRYRLDEGLVAADVWHLEESLAPSATDGSATEAGQLYAGHLLAGEDFAWAEPVRERLRRRVIRHLTALADAMRDAGDLEAALRAAEQSVECDPHDEDLYLRVMALQDQLGRRDAVRRTYEAMDASLQEIGTSPSERSRSLLLEPSGQREQRPGDA